MRVGEDKQILPMASCSTSLVLSSHNAAVVVVVVDIVVVVVALHCRSIGYLPGWGGAGTESRIRYSLTTMVISIASGPHKYIHPKVK